MVNIERINDYAQAHETHKDQLEVLAECQRDIYRTLKTIDLKAAGEYKFISKVACYVMAENIDDVNHGVSATGRLQPFVTGHNRPSTHDVVR